MFISNPIRATCVFFIVTKLIVSSSWSQLTENKVSPTPYAWKSVQIVGGGFADEIIFHPKAKCVRYCRTDMGGAYRCNDTNKRWESMMDFISYTDLNLMGIESIALDPNDPNFVIIACGTYTNQRAGNGAILRSFNLGKTFERINVPFKFGRNGNGRGNGERMSVDPLNGNIIYLGTRLNGLWKSIKKGKTLEQIKTFPDIIESSQPNMRLDCMQRRRSMFQNWECGVIVTLFDTCNSASKGFSIVYAFVSLAGSDIIFSSKDRGKTCQPFIGQPIQYRPAHAVLAADSNLYITYGDNAGPNTMTNGAVWKYNLNINKWMEITPDKPNAAENRKFGYAAVSTDAQHPETVIVSTFNRYKAGGEEIFRSLNGGLSWKQIFKTGEIFNEAAAPYVENAGIHWLFDIEIDPFDSNHAMFTTSYGMHETFNLTDVDKDQPTTWTVMSKGIEETVALELLSPPKGANLITAIGDYGGFVHWNLDKPVQKGNLTNPHFNNTDGVSCAENNPDVIVRVGIASHPDLDFLFQELHLTKQSMLHWNLRHCPEIMQDLSIT